MRADLQATPVPVDPTAALKGRADHYRLAADRDGVANRRVLRSYRSRRSRYRDPMRNRLWYQTDVVVGDIEEHHTRLSARNLVGIALFVHSSRQREELRLASHVFVL